MKTRDLEKLLNGMGYYLVRQSSHKVFSNGVHTLTMPHHVEINPFLAKKIIKQATDGSRQLSLNKVA